MDNLDFGALSEREQAIIELAMEGMTDQQIGNRLDISPSTVNSYWVRIRGKLGHLSRTELVSRILQQRALEENSRLKRRIQELEENLETTREAVWNNEMADELRLSLETLPEPVLVIDQAMSVRFANARAGQLLGYPAREIIGVPFSQIIRGSHEILSQEKFKAGRVLKYGVESVLYGVRRDRSLARVIAVMGFSEDPANTLCVCILRPFTEELDTLRRRAGTVASQAMLTN